MVEHDAIIINKSFLLSFVKLFNLYWRSAEKWKAGVFVIISVLLTIGGVQGSVLINTANKEFFDSLQNFNMAGVLSAIIPIGLGVLIWIGAETTAFFCKERLSVKWRLWLTNYHLAQWFNQHKHYHLQMENSVDNPDQRISEDLDSFPNLNIGLFFLGLSFVLTLGSYAYILCGVSNTLVFSVAQHKITIYGYLLWCAIFYGILSIFFTQKIGKKLSSLDFIKEQFGANFRLNLVRSREFSEQIALLNDGQRETNRLSNLFNDIFINSFKIIDLRTKINFCTGFFAGSGAIVGSIVALPLFFSKQIQIGTLMQISGAFSMVLSSFSMLAQSFDVFAKWKTVVFRLIQFQKVMEQNNNSQNLIITKALHNQIVINDLTTKMPNGQIIVSNINMTFNLGYSYLIQDESGSGKSVFLRTLAGIWPYAEGKISLPEHKSMCFLPQKPYLPYGSMQDLVLSDHKHASHDEELQELFKLVNLHKYIPHMYEAKNWQNILSLGEQQRLFLVQIFIKKPDILFLDEATSALDIDAEINFYQLLKNRLPMTTIISVGHRTSLKNFHQYAVLISKAKNAITEDCYV